MWINKLGVKLKVHVPLWKPSFELKNGVNYRSEFLHDYSKTTAWMNCEPLRNTIHALECWNTRFFLFSSSPSLLHLQRAQKNFWETGKPDDGDERDGGEEVAVTPPERATMAVTVVGTWEDGCHNKRGMVLPELHGSRVCMIMFIATQR